MFPKFTIKNLLIVLAFSAVMFGILMLVIYCCPAFIAAFIFIPWLLSALADGADV